MGFNFPDAPTPGQVFGNYTWDAATSAWKLTASGGSGGGGGVSPIATGNVLANVSGLTANPVAEPITPFTLEASGYASLAAAITAIGATQATLVISSKYTLSANLTFPANISLHIVNGGGFVQGAAWTLTINGILTAPPVQIFFGISASQFIASTKTMIGYPEWFGAFPNNSAIDCAFAIARCCQLFPITQLQIGDYYIQSTIKLQTPQRQLRGCMESYGYHAGSTRIIINSATVTGIQMGLDADPGTGIGSFPQDITLRDFTIYRSVVPANPATAASTDGCIGIAVQWCLSSWIIRVQSWENIIGFWLAGAVNVKFEGCYSGRSIPCATATNDHFEGYFFYGSSGLAAAGGNASIYLTKSGVGCGLSTSIPSSGFTFSTCGADTFMTECEVAVCNNGVTYVGSVGTSKEQAGDADIHFTNCILDGITNNGFLFLNVAKGGLIEVVGCYVGLAGGSSGYGVQVNNSLGAISLIGGQVVGWPAASGTGISISSSSGIKSSMKLLDCVFPVSINSSSCCDIQDVITNISKSVSSHGAVNVTNSARCRFQPIVKGGTSYISYGVNLVGTGNSYCTVDPTMVDPVTVGAKVVINGVSIIALGASGTHQIVGVIA